MPVIIQFAHHSIKGLVTYSQVEHYKMQQSFNIPKSQN